MREGMGGRDGGCRDGGRDEGWDGGVAMGYRVEGRDGGRGGGRRHEDRDGDWDGGPGWAQGGWRQGWGRRGCGAEMRAAWPRCAPRSHVITQFNRGLYDYIVATDEEAAPSAAPVELQQRRKRKGAAERWGRGGGAGGEPGTRGCHRGLGVLLETQGCC